MNQKSIAIAAILSATIFTALFTTAPPFNMKDAEGQIIIPILGRQDTTESRSEQNII
jgi:hypothetical protein